MAGFVDDLSAWGAELIAVLDDQAAYALMACRHPLAHEIPVVFSGVNYPNISLLLQYPNITGYADTPDYLRTIRMIESIMGKSRICLMNGQVFLDRKIWHALNEQCRGQGFAIVTSTEGAYFAGSSYHRVRERETISPILKRQNIDVLLDTTKIVRMTSDSIAIRHLMWLGRGDNTIHTPGHAPIIAGLLQNIQELKDHEQELIESRELAEQAELKQSFLNNMSHEIRTPLNAIVGFSDMLANEPEFSNEERQEFVDIINTNTKLLLKLVGDVLELSRIESGNLSFTFQRESVCRLLDDVYQTHSLLIRPPLQFLKDFPPEDVQVNVDPMRLTQVLTNFLNNANKFTKEGSIQLGYCCPSGMSEVHLYVEDTGIGIPHSEQKMIFERFYKRSEFSQGVGLGLSICVLIVEKMGGRIELRSEEGRGSRFTVVLPCIE